MEFLQTFGTMSPEEFQKKAIEDPNIMRTISEQGHNIIHICIITQNYTLLKFLSERYDISDLVNQPIINGNTPLHLFFLLNKFSHRSTNLNVLKILLENGGNLFLKNRRGKTPFSAFQEKLEFSVLHNFSTMETIYEETLNRGENNTDVISLYNWAKRERERIERRERERRE